MLDDFDCKTKKYLKLKVSKSMESKLIGRNYVDNKSGELTEITEDTKLTNSTILLRSPIYCKSKIGICKICYGKLAEKLNTKFIGIMSGGVMNDVGVKLPH
jgi:hypothetical protein